MLVVASRPAPYCRGIVRVWPDAGAQLSRRQPSAVPRSRTFVAGPAGCRAEQPPRSRVATPVDVQAEDRRRRCRETVRPEVTVPVKGRQRRRRSGTAIECKRASRPPGSKQPETAEMTGNRPRTPTSRPGNFRRRRSPVLAATGHIQPVPLRPAQNRLAVPTTRDGRRGQPVAKTRAFVHVTSSSQVLESNSRRMRGAA